MMESLLHIPPGYRFHPTEEELVDYYLKKKVASPRMELNVIKEVDLYKIEPWDIQEICGRGDVGEEREWYFFSHKDKKYPMGTRTNRATASGFWKATGRDKAIHAKQDLIGMRKTLVFYKGRAPNGQKSDWIMHEYRLETDENGPPQEEGWVVCRVFKKKLTNNVNVNNRRAMMGDHQESWFMQIDGRSGYHHLPPLLESPRTFQASSSSDDDHHNNYNGLYGTLLGDDHNNNNPPSTLPQYPPLFSSEPILDEDRDANVTDGMMMMMMDTSDDHHDGIMDWRVLDKFVASQLMSQEDDEDISKESPSTSSSSLHETFHHLSDKQAMPDPTNAPSGCLYPWK